MTDAATELTHSGEAKSAGLELRDTKVVIYTAPTALAGRYGLSEELAARLAGIDALTDGLVDA